MDYDYERARRLAIGSDDERVHKDYFQIAKRCNRIVECAATELHDHQFDALMQLWRQNGKNCIVGEFSSPYGLITSLELKLFPTGSLSVPGALRWLERLDLQFSQDFGEIVFTPTVRPYKVTTSYGTRLMHYSPQCLERAPPKVHTRLIEERARRLRAELRIE